MTEEILEATLERRGHAVERRRELIGFEQGARGVEALVRHEDGVEETIRSQFLVSCEGAHSAIRKQAMQEVALALVQQLADERAGKENVRIRDPLWLNPGARLLRERLVFPILRTAFVQRRLFAKVSQLEMNYRGQSLAVHLDGWWPFSRARVRAGDRTPDVIFKRAGEKVSLLQLIGSGGTIALLGPGAENEKLSAALSALQIRPYVISPKEIETPAADRLEDLYGDFARLHGARGAFIYEIRPDGHVGLFQQKAQASALAAYLKKIRAREVVEKVFFKRRITARMDSSAARRRW